MEHNSAALLLAQHMGQPWDESIEQSRDSALRPPILAGPQAEELTLLLEQTAGYYPNQELHSLTTQGFLFDYGRLVMKYSLPRVREAFLDMRIRPGQNFFPRPNEVAEEIEATMAAERKAREHASPWNQCSKCTKEGFVFTADERGVKTARRCDCWLDHFRHREPMRDAKAMAGGER